MRALRIFVSSTYADLVEYRQAASSAIIGLGHQSDDMELWSADDRSGVTYSVDRVKQCDVFVLLLAHRYGTIPHGEQYSITELEYRAARDAGIPVLAFFVDPEVPWPPQDIDWQCRDQLQKFKNGSKARLPGNNSTLRRNLPFWSRRLSRTGSRVQRPRRQRGHSPKTRKPLRPCQPQRLFHANQRRITVHRLRCGRWSRAIG